MIETYAMRALSPAQCERDAFAQWLFDRRMGWSVVGPQPEAMHYVALNAMRSKPLIWC